MIRGFLGFRKASYSSVWMFMHFKPFFFSQKSKTAEGKKKNPNQQR